MISYHVAAPYQGGKSLSTTLITPYVYTYLILIFFQVLSIGLKGGEYPAVSEHTAGSYHGHPQRGPP